MKCGVVSLLALNKAVQVSKMLGTQLMLQSLDIAKLLTLNALLRGHVTPGSLVAL
jgi:hypothetical protein